MFYSPNLNPQQRRNFLLCVGNGALVQTGMAFFAFETIFAGLAFSLTGSKVLVGLLTGTAQLGWLWPQIFAGSRIEHLERKLHVYNWTVGIRLAAHVGMITALLACRGRPLLLYWFLWGCIVVFSSAGGVCVIPFMDIVAKTIPAHHRSMLLGYRRLFGGLGGFLAGLAAVYVLSPQSGIAFPWNYTALLAVGLVFCAVAYGCFMRTDEPPGPAAAARRPFREFLRDGMRVCARDPHFRRFFLYRVAFHTGVMAYPLLAPFVMETFGASADITGWFAATVALSAGISSLAWGRLAQRWGEASLFRVCTALLLLSPGIALAAALLSATPWASGWIAQHYVWVVLSVFLIHTVSINGTGIAGTVYLLGMPPEDQRPLYLAFMNTLSAPLVLTPVAAGVLASAHSYAAAFGASFLAGICALLIAFRLRNQG